MRFRGCDRCCIFSCDCSTQMLFRHLCLNLFYLFSVTRRSRSDESHLLTYWVTNWVSVSIDFTDVTLVSDDSYRRLYWCDPEDHDESYLVMKVIGRWKLSTDESYLVMKVIYWWKLSSDESYLVIKVIHWWKLSSGGNYLVVKVI